MSNEQRELTEEGYKIEVLKARMSKMMLDYEDQIANYEIALQQARQQVQALQQPKANEPEAKAG